MWSEYISLDGVVEEPGAGKRLFEHRSEPVSIRLVGSRSFETGVVALTYHQAD